LAGLIGEPAPPLAVKEWIQGSSFEVKPGTNIFVVEFWSSMVPGNSACVTNLNAAAYNFRTNGVTVVGISDEPVEAIKKYMQAEGTNIQYAVAADDHRKTSISYLAPIKQRALPFAFIVATNGVVLWHGHPLAVNKALGLITTGKFRMELAEKYEVASHQMEQYLSLARRSDTRTKAAGAALLKNRTNDVSLLCDLAYVISTERLPKRDFSLAGEALDQAEKIASDTNRPSVMSIRAAWLFASGKQNEGMALATQALASAQSPASQNSIKLLVHSMESQLAAAKDNQDKTNQINSLQPPVQGASAAKQSTASQPPAGSEAARKP
jgi:peroxiredoxin